MADDNSKNKFSVKGILQTGKKFTKDLSKTFADGEKLSESVNKVFSEGKKIAENASAAVKDPDFKVKVSKGINDAFTKGQEVATKAIDIGKEGAKKVASGTSKAVDTTKDLANKVQAKTEEIMTSEQMVKTLDDIYGKAMNGIPAVSKSVDELAADYIAKNHDPEKAAKSLINNQILKCTTSGFLSGLGGILTLAVALPANITSVLYVQLRMIAAIARIGGFDPNDDQVQSIVYACLTGQAVGDVLKSAGIKIGEKFATASIGKITGATLTKINQAVGFRLITKFGEKGIINLGKMVPVVGGVIGGGFDLVSTRIIASNAYKLFIEKSTDFETTDSDPNIIDAEVVRSSLENAERDIKDIFSVYSEDKNYVEHVKKVCDELDIPYRETKVQVFSFMSVRCDPVKLTQLALKLNEYGEYTISAVTTEDISTINSWK